jgi:formate dehydrogenase major subunit
MAECHPVGFQWVMEAKARGATVIHVDPRFTRTSALADLHVPLRAGSDIVFLGGIVNYVLASGKYFRDYVVNYTNAATLLTEDFADTEDLDGVFSGLDREHRTYDFEAWRYQGGEVSAAAGRRDRPEEPEDPEDPEEDHGAAHREVRQAGRGEAHGAGGAAAHRDPDRDETLQHPRCVFQVLKRHFARYTPDMVEQACGVPPEVFARVCEMVTDNSGPERTTALVYSVGWTQHTVGAQYIRTAAILQLLLGNIGRPGGGILALRGHASIQGSTDIPTLFDLLPGYLPTPHVHGNEDLATYVDAESTDKGFWADMGSYLVSLLKAWWGEAATADNDFCYDYLPRLTGSHSTYETVAAQIAGDCPGYFLFGENPAVGSANGRMQRFGLAALDWLVVRDLVLIESATFWQNGPEIETGGARRTSAPRSSSCPPPRTPRRTARSPTPSGCCSGTTRRSSRPGTCAATCGSPTTSAAGSGRSWPLRPTRWTGRCRISPGITRWRGRWPSRRPRPCWPRSTAGTPTGSRCRRTRSSRTTDRPPAVAGSTAGSGPTA